MVIFIICKLDIDNNAPANHNEKSFWMQLYLETCNMRPAIVSRDLQYEAGNCI